MPKVRAGHTALTWSPWTETGNLEQAIVELAELGFRSTEAGGHMWELWEQQRPGQLKPLLERAGMVMACLFQSGEYTIGEQAPDLIVKGQRWAWAVQQLGGNVLELIPKQRSRPAYGLEDHKVMAHTMNEIGRRARQEGAICVMHPHWGTPVETRLEIDLLMDLLDPACVGMAPDTGQIAKAGVSSIEVVQPWVQRVQYVHLKDVSPDWAEMLRRGVPLRSPEGYSELGLGVEAVKEFIELLLAAGYEGWLMAELDETTRTPKESAAINRDFLVGMGLSL